MEEKVHLYETDEGDRWVCLHCGREEKKMIEEKGWTWIFDRDDLTLRCSICSKADYDYEDYT